MKTPRPPLVGSVYRLAAISQRREVMESQARDAVSLARRLSAPAAMKIMYVIPKKEVQHALKRRKMVSERYRDDGYPTLVK